MPPSSTALNRFYNTYYGLLLLPNAAAQRFFIIMCNELLFFKSVVLCYLHRGLSSSVLARKGSNRRANKRNFNT